MSGEGKETSQTGRLAHGIFDQDSERFSASNIRIGDDDVMMVSYSNGESSSEQIGLQIGVENMVIGAVGGCDDLNGKKVDDKEGESSKSLNGAAEFKFVSDYTSEAVRLASYRSWPHTAPVNPSALARAGLYYTGKDDIVQCFSCDGQIKDWEYGDTAMGEHKSLFPDCGFVKGTDDRNDPLIKDRSRSGLSNASSSTKDTEEDDKQKGGPKDTGSSGKKGKKKKGKKKKGKKKQDDDDDDEDDTSSIYNIEDDPQFKEANRVLKSEYKRLLTFIYFPKNAHVQPEDLAKAGFYYCGSDDRVQCFCCYGILKNWRPGDSAMSEHRKYFPSCPFVRGEDVGNEPMRLLTTRQSAIDDTPIKRPGATDPNRVENYQTSRPQTTRYLDGASNTPAQQRPQSQARHPEYTAESARRATYINWPSTDIVEPQDLCRAGFYYTGIRDNVKCFFCDGGLRNWEAVDEPWIEHARWFPKCEYVLKERGSAFVNYVTTRFPSVPSSNPQASPSENRPRGSAQPRVHDFMRTDLVQVVLDMGYSKDLVKRVVKRQIKKTGGSFSSTHDLLIAVWDLETEISASGQTNSDFLGDEDDEEEEEKANEGAAAELTRPNSELASGVSTPEDLQRELETLRDQKTCKVCMDRDVCMLFQPCGHLVTCEVCSQALRQCPICRKNIRSTIRTYMS